MKQPNFQEIFFNYFGNSPKKVEYKLRNDSNCYHDLVFINSLIHDARFKFNKTKKNKNKLTFFIERDCWELGIQDKENFSGLYITKSELLMSPILDIEFRTANISKININNELWIRTIELTPNFEINNDDIEIKLVGFDWSIVMKSKSSKLILKLNDLEVPYLIPMKTKKE